MASSISLQRDLVINLKKETFSNVRILSKLQPMPQDLTRQIFKDNALEKPTQNVFNHLAYYLVSIVDSQASNALPWPLYDTKTERAYRNELSAFINDYGEKGLLTPVVSSYLVNPGCYKVTMLLFQLSQLAVQRVLEKKMKKESQKILYKDFTNKCKPSTISIEDLQKAVDTEVQTIVNKRANYIKRREATQKVATMLRNQISKMEQVLEKTGAQDFIDNLVDNYVANQKLDEAVKDDILKVKNVHEQPEIFDQYLLEVDEHINKIETEWTCKTTPFLNLCRETFKNSETLIARQTGADKASFTIEYNHKTDQICTTELQKYVNSEQKYVLKNIVQEQRLNFPNLIRGFLISMGFIMKNTEIGDDIYKFNEYLDGGHSRYSEIAMSLRNLIERVMNAETRITLQSPPNISNQSISIRDLTEIPQLPDLTDLKMTRFTHPTVNLHLNRTRQQFNMRRQTAESFIKPLSKSFLTTPIHRGPRDDFLKSVISCCVSTYDQMGTSQFNHTISSNVHKENKANETMAQCTGFTKQQLIRLLSTKKSSAKKFKHTKRPDVKIKKGNLFNESTLSTFNGSISLLRSHSSPNLLEVGEKTRIRRLSTMKEDSPPVLEVSGITALDRDSNQSTPRETCSLEMSRKVAGFNSTPSITVTGVSSKISLTETSNQKSVTEVSSKHSITGDSSKLSVTRGSSKLSVTGGSSKLSVTGGSSKLSVTGGSSKLSVTGGSSKLSVTGGSNKLSIAEGSSKTSLTGISRTSLTRPSSKTSLIDIKNVDLQSETQKRKTTESIEPKPETPVTNTRLIKKTGSLEKIINRFKKIRESVLPEVKPQVKDFTMIDEEKENFMNTDFFKVNKNLLPDLLSPSCSTITQRSTDIEKWFDSDDDMPRRPRESLGTALGVDHTFLDQFDLDSD